MRGGGATGALALSLVVVLASCGGDTRSGDAGWAPPPRAVAPGDTLELDRWNLDEVVVRLEESGLAVQRTGEEVDYPGLRQQGELVRVGGSDMHVFVYANAADRRADGADLPADLTPADVEGARRGRVIATNNLIAIYYPRTELQFERVSNVLLARYTQDR